MTIAFLFVSILLLVGFGLRRLIPLFRWLFIPASVVAGFVGLAVIQAGHGLSGVKVGDFTGWTNSSWGSSFSETLSDCFSSLSVAANSLSETLSGWPGWLIAVVFAGMLLERKQSNAKDSVRRVARQGIMVWVIVLGETAVGLLATWFFILPFFDVPNSIGMLIETGFAGGHGTAAAMGEVFAAPHIDLTGGKDLGMLMATCGLVYGIVTGIFWINLGVRRGWITSSEKSKVDEPDHEGDPIGFAKVDSATMDPLLLQVVWLAIAFGLGMIAQQVVSYLAASADGWLASGEVVKGVEGAEQQLAKRLSISNVVDFPLFIYTLFGGLFVRRLLSAVGKEELIDNQTISRLTSSAMDILVVAAIASLNLSAVAALVVPFSILFACGAIWTAICLLLISRLLLPKEHWFQLGLINYGMSTGTTATGFVLLRMVDPELESGAAEDYALAAPLSAPFVGGGMITIALPLLLLERVPIAVPAMVVSGVVVALIFAGRFLAAKR